LPDETEANKLAKKRCEKKNHLCRLRLVPHVFVYCCLLGIGSTYNTAVHAEDEISAIRFTDYEGYVEMRFREDEQTTSSDGSTSTETRTSQEEELFLLAHGYIYHPKFLNMDLGFGYVFKQSDFETNFAAVNDNSSDYNLIARLRFLDEKLYPLFLYYEKAHPSVELTMTDHFQQESEKYGFNFQLKQPLLPVSLSFASSRQKTEGQGFDVRIDDITEQNNIRADIPMGKDGYGRFAYTSTSLDSRSGFLSQPVNTTNIKTDSTTFDSRVFLGKQKQFQWSNFLSYIEQSDVRPLKELRYNPELRWIHSQQMASFYRLRYVNSDQVAVQTTDYNASGGFRYELSDKTNIDADLHVEKNDTTGLKLSNYGIAGNISHKREYAFGSLNLSASWKHDYFDRQVTSNVPVRDLTNKLIGTAQQFLPHDNIISSSTIRVFRILSGSETELTVGVDTSCADSIDILVTTIGARTQIENCNGATDGEITVSIDYDYDPGGTVSYSNFIQGYQANLKLYQHSNLYLRWRDSAVSISSGSPTLSLDESTNTQVGVRIDYPLHGTVSVGGEVSFEKEEGSLISFDREAEDVYVQFGLFRGKMRLSTRRVTVDYLNTREDVDLTRQALQFRVRPWNKISLSLDMSDEEDRGGISNRHTKILAMKARWRIRKFIMNAETRVIKERYNTTNIRDRSMVKITIRRDF